MLALMYCWIVFLMLTHIVAAHRHGNCTSGHPVGLKTLKRIGTSHLIHVMLPFFLCLFVCIKDWVAVLSTSHLASSEARSPKDNELCFVQQHTFIFCLWSVYKAIYACKEKWIFYSLAVTGYYFDVLTFKVRLLHIVKWAMFLFLHMVTYLFAGLTGQLSIMSI